MVYSNSYLYKSRHNIYYFRVIFPSHAKEGSRQYEYRKSLHTRDLEVARSRGRLLRIYVELHQEGVKYGLMEWNEFKHQLDQYLKKMLDSEKQRISSQGPRPASIEQMWKNINIKNYEDAAEKVSMERAGFIDMENQIPEDPIPDCAYQVTDSFLSAHKIPIDYSDKVYLGYCEAILQMQIKLHKQLMQLNEEARSFGTLPNISKLKTETEKGVESSIVSLVFKDFVAERVDGKIWESEKTVDEYRASLDRFVSIVGDRPIASVGYEEARHFKKSLLKLPSNMNKKPIYRERTINELLKMNIPDEDKLGILQINKYIGQISSFYNWSIEQGHVTLNPFKGLKLKDSASKQDKKLPFCNDDLVAIFSTKQYLTGKYLHPYYYWLPLLGLYTGARINELCQLYLDDIYEVEGVWVIDFNERSEDKSIKTHGKGYKTIPIHSKVIDAGFLEYVTTLRSSKEERLFPELPKKKNGYATNASKWFSAYWQKCGENTDKKSFHSFRHTVINFLKQNGKFSKELIMAISGHKDESVVFGTYGKMYEPKVLVEAIESLNFPIDVPAYKNHSK